MNRFGIFILILILVSINIDAAKGNNALKDIEKEYSKAVVYVETEDANGDKGSGSGFFINEYGSILTCHHVIEDAKKINVKWEGKNIAAYPLFVLENQDQAIIQIYQKNTPYVKIQLPLNVERLDTVMVMGHPLGVEELNVNVGKISAIYEEGLAENKWLRIYQSDVVINPGNSGGPAFDEDGNVIGVATAKIDPEKYPGVTGMNFINWISEIVKEHPMLFQEHFYGNKPWAMETDENDVNYYRFADFTLYRNGKSSSMPYLIGIAGSAPSGYSESGIIHYNDAFVFGILGLGDEIIHNLGALVMSREVPHKAAVLMGMEGLYLTSNDIKAEIMSLEVRIKALEKKIDVLKEKNKSRISKTESILDKLEYIHSIAQNPAVKEMAVEYCIEEIKKL